MYAKQSPNTKRFEVVLTTSPLARLKISKPKPNYPHIPGNQINKRHIVPYRSKMRHELIRLGHAGLVIEIERKIERNLKNGVKMSYK